MSMTFQNSFDGFVVPEAADAGTESERLNHELFGDTDNEADDNELHLL